MITSITWHEVDTGLRKNVAYSKLDVTDANCCIGSILLLLIFTDVLLLVIVIVFLLSFVFLDNKLISK